MCDQLVLPMYCHFVRQILNRKYNVLVQSAYWNTLILLSSTSYIIKHILYTFIHQYRMQGIRHCPSLSCTPLNYFSRFLLNFAKFIRCSSTVFTAHSNSMFYNKIYNLGYLAFSKTTYQNIIYFCILLNESQKQNNSLPLHPIIVCRKFNYITAD